MQLISESNRNRAALIGVLIVVCLLLFFFRLGERNLWDSLETRIAATTQEMMASGDYLVPRLNGELLATKPLLYHWMVSLFARPFGLLPLTARLPAAILATAGVLLTFFLGERLLGRGPAFLGSLVLATSSSYWWLARFAWPDMALAFFIILALFSFHRAISGGSSRYYLLMYLALALGTLAKGPLAIGLPALIVIVYLGLSGQIRRVKEMRLWEGVLIVLLVAGPWYLAVTLRSGSQFLAVFLFSENLERFVGTGKFTNLDPFWYYVPYFFADFFPWSVFFPFAFVISLWPSRGPARPLPPSGRAGGDERRKFLFLLVWFAVLFIFFSASSYKYRRYILPLYPAAALLVGNFWHELMHRKGESFLARSFSIANFILAGFLALAGLSLPVFAWMKAGQYFLPALAGGFSLVIVAAFLLVWAKSKRPGRSFALICGVTVALFTGYTLAIVPKIDAQRTSKPFMEKVLALVGPKEDLRAFQVWKPAFPYYTKRAVPLIPNEAELSHLSSRDERLYVIADEQAYGRLPASLRGLFRIVFEGHVDRRSVLLLCNRECGPAATENKMTRVHSHGGMGNTDQRGQRVPTTIEK